MMTKQKTEIKMITKKKIEEQQLKKTQGNPKYEDDPTRCFAAIWELKNNKKEKSLLWRMIKEK